MVADAVGGDDEADGLTPDTAVQSLAVAQALLSADRPILYLRRGATWRESLLVPISGITVQPYGTGTDPIPRITAADVATGWSKTAGKTNVYQCATDVEQVGGRTVFVLASEDEVLLTRAASVDACDAAESSYYVSDDTSETPTLYVHATGHGNPAANGKLYEYSARQNPISARTVDDLTAMDLLLDMPAQIDGCIVCRERATLYRLTLRNGNRHNVLAGDGALLEDVQCNDALTRADLGLSPVDRYQDDPSGQGWTATRVVVAITPRGVDGTAFSGHSDGVASFGQVVYDACGASGIGGTYSGSNSDLASVTNHRYDLLTPNLITTDQPYRASHCTLAASQVAVQHNKAGAPVTLDDVVIHSGSAYNAIQIAGAGAVLVIDDSEILDCDGALYCAAAAAELHANGCTVRPLYAWRLQAADSVYTGDYNHYRAGAQFQYRSDSGYLDFAGWQAATGQDAHSAADL